MKPVDSVTSPVDTKQTDEELIAEICKLTSEMYSLDYVVSQTKEQVYDAEMHRLTKKYSSMFDELSAAEGMIARLVVIDSMRDVLDEMIHLRGRFLKEQQNVD